MDDKQIIELYWNRSGEAIKETKEKYGQYCSYIAHHILQNVEEAESCVKECYAMLWDSIPPRKPQNLKAYLCKITRNHALHMRYPELNEQATDLFTAELMIQDFLKGLEPEQRKLFVAHYWYFVPVSEIALQYKTSENKVNTTLVSLREKLDDVLVQKGIQLQFEAELFYAMTEIDDCYLEEAAPQMSVGSKVTEEEKANSARVFLKDWKKYSIPAMACMLVLILAVVVWPKKPVEQNPSESGSEGDYFNSGTGVLGTESTEVEWYSGEYLTAEDFQNRMNALPWGVAMDLAAMPIFKNLAYYSKAGEPVYLDVNSLLVKAEKIAQNLNTKINSYDYTWTKTGEPWMIEAKTDAGEIQVLGNGNVDILFAEGVQIPKEYQMFTHASMEKANDSVLYLVEHFKDVLSNEDWTLAPYISYNAQGYPNMNYRAVGSDLYGIDNIMAHYFCNVSFSYNNYDGLLGIHEKDLRQSSELVGYYPIISVEEAKLLLQEGKYIIDFMELGEWEYDESLIQGVELMYRCPQMEKYFQPFYCFYLKKADSNRYQSFYVPAIKGVNIEEMLPPEKEVTIVDMGDGFFGENLVYYSEEKFSTINGFEKVNVNTNVFDAPLTYQGKEYAIQFSWCEVGGEIFPYLNEDQTEGDFSLEKIPDCTDKILLHKIIEMGGTEAVFLCDLSQQTISFLLDIDTVKASSINSVSVSSNLDAIIVNTHWEDKTLLYTQNEVVDLSKLAEGLKVDTNGTIGASFVEDKIIISNYTYKPGDTFISCYKYDIATKSLECIIDNEKMDISDGRYFISEGENREITIMDRLDGSCVETGLLEAEITNIYDVSAEHFAFVSATGETVLLEKESGQIIQQYGYKLNFSPSAMVYKNDMLYVEDSCGRYLVLILTD